MSKGGSRFRVCSRECRKATRIRSEKLTVVDLLKDPYASIDPRCKKITSASELNADPYSSAIATEDRSEVHLAYVDLLRFCGGLVVYFSMLVRR